MPRIVKGISPSFACCWATSSAFSNGVLFVGANSLMMISIVNLNYSVTFRATMLSHQVNSNFTSKGLSGWRVEQGEGSSRFQVRYLNLEGTGLFSK